MGFNIRPGMSIWNSTTKDYKKEYYIYAAKMEKLKFENDRKIMQKEEKEEKEKQNALVGLNKGSSSTEKNWYGWMEY